MKKDFMPMAVVVRMREIKKSVYDNKRDLALSQIGYFRVVYNY